MSYGLINNIDKYNINHNCKIDKYSSGSPILNLKSKKVIGIQKENSINYNIGTLLKFPLKDFINNKYYAMKVIPIKGETKEKIQKLEKEAKILSKFNCNNIVKYYDSSKNNNNIYILMEYCDGDNIRNLIDKNYKEDSLIEEDTKSGQ